MKDEQCKRICRAIELVAAMISIGTIALFYVGIEIVVRLS